jgi:hypothetical protein
VGRHFGWLAIPLLMGAIIHGVARAADSPAIPDVCAIQSPEPDRRGTAQQPLVVSKPTEEMALDAAQESARARNELITTWATALLTIFTAALWLVNILLIKDARRVSERAAKETQDALREQTRAADAMHDVAEATKNNAALMSGMLSKQMRAYIQVNIGTSTAQREDVVFGSWPEIVNVGLTPAKRVSYRIMADILDPRFGADFVYPEPEQVFTNDATLNPRQTFKIMAVVKRRFDPAEVATISDGTAKRLFVWGAVTYDDVFDGHHETRFSHNFIFFDRTDPDTGKVEHKVNSWYSTGHNDAT